MTHRPPLRALTAALVATISLGLSGCGKVTEGAGPPPPAISAGTVLDDTVITSSVKAALIADPDIKSLDFKVETRKGEVLLSGFVDNEVQLNRALEIARGVTGAVKVTNEMVIKK